VDVRAAIHNVVTHAVAGAVGLFSPAAAMRYMSGRTALLSYAAARRSGSNGRWRPRDLHPDLQSARDRKLVQARARELVHSNPNVGGAIRKICNNVVFTGMWPQAQLRDASGRRDHAVNTAAENQYRAWADAVDMVELQQLAVRHLWQDGGFLLHTYPDTVLYEQGLVPLGIELLDLDRLDRSVHGQLPSGNTALWGCEFDPHGRPAAYHVRMDNPLIAMRAMGETVRLDARWCRMVMVRDQIGQTQPMSWLATVIMTMHDFDEYQTSERIAARLAAAFGVFVIPPKDDTCGNALNGNPLTGGSSTDGQLFSGGHFIESGRIDQLPPGYEVQIAEHNRPGNAYEPYTRTTLRSASAGIGMSAEAFSNDYSDASYSSVRQAVLEERRGYMVQQDTLVRKVLHHVWLQWCQLRHVFGLGAEPALPCRWQRPGWQWVDPAKDAKAAETRLALGLTTRRQLCAESGLDFDDVVDGLREEAQQLREAGLNPEPWRSATPAENTGTQDSDDTGKQNEE